MAPQRRPPQERRIFDYTNDQRASTLWYHDHALGITRVNVYAGLAGFWILRDSVEDGLNLPGPAPKLGDPAAPLLRAARRHPGPLLLGRRRPLLPRQPRALRRLHRPLRAASHVSPIWNPEFFGDTIMVNGKTWPYVEVEPRLYRLRLLNGCNARTLILKLDKPARLPQIGNEGGLLPTSPCSRRSSSWRRPSGPT